MNHLFYESATLILKVPVDHSVNKRKMARTKMTNLVKTLFKNMSQNSERAKALWFTQKTIADLMNMPTTKNKGLIKTRKVHILK